MTSQIGGRKVIDAHANCTDFGPERAATLAALCGPADLQHLRGGGLVISVYEGPGRPTVHRPASADGESASRFDQPLHVQGENPADLATQNLKVERARRPGRPLSSDAAT
ncbi:hypothetical protein ACVBEQ_26415 [Nakamurella sp. GG22]